MAPPPATERGGDTSRDLRVANGIEPDVGILVGEEGEPFRVQELKHLVPVARRVLELRLEAVAEEENQVGVAQGGDVVG